MPEKEEPCISCHRPTKSYCQEKKERAYICHNCLRWYEDNALNHDDLDELSNRERMIAEKLTDLRDYYDKDKEAKEKQLWRIKKVFDKTDHNFWVQTETCSNCHEVKEWQSRSSFGGWSRKFAFSCGSGGLILAIGNDDLSITDEVEAIQKGEYTHYEPDGYLTIIIVKDCWKDGKTKNENIRKISLFAQKELV